jgi:hypothetical protein
MSSTELQAFESASHGSIEITKLSGYTLGSEATTNGTFASSISGWVGTDWDYSASNSGQAIHTPGTTDPLAQSIAITSGTTYEISFTSAARTAGNFSVLLGNQLLVVNGVSTFTTDGTYTGRIRANQTATVALSVLPSSLFDGAITTISMKPVVWS